MNKSRLFLALLLAGCCFSARCVLAQGPNTNLPFYDGFEGYLNLTPLVDGLNGWYSDGGWHADPVDAYVQTDMFCPNPSVITNFQDSSRAAKIPVDVLLANRFENLPAENVWVQMDLAAVFYDGDEPPIVASDVAVMLYIDEDGYFVVHNANAPATNWVTITETATGEPAAPITNDWVRLNFYQDYTKQTWTLFADSILLMEDIHFVDPGISRFSGLDIYNGMGTSFMDNVAATIENPPDLQPGNWLPALNVSTSSITQTIQQGETATNQTFVIDNPSGSYYDMSFSNTISYSDGSDGWLSIDISSGTVEGDEQIEITISYTTSHLISREEGYSATITIDAKDAKFGFDAENSGWEIEVFLRVESELELSVDPRTLEQTVNRGGNPTNQVFSVWNAGVPPVEMNFEVFGLLPSWLSLSKYEGVSTGEQHVIQVRFDDMSEEPTGTKEGTINIRAWGDTGYGVVTQISDVAVAITIIGPPAPSVVRASTNDTEKVIVNWDPAHNAERYEVWRGDTFDFDYAHKIAEVSTTNYNDRTTSPGRLYYYWVKSVSIYGVIGDESEYAAGCRALSPPGGLFASTGTYTNRIRIIWSASTGADSYELHRRTQGGTFTKVFHARGLSYDDMEVEPGVKYEYRARARNPRFSSGLGDSDTGYVLSPPSDVSASDGIYEQRVRVRWKGADSATDYLIWRSEVNLANRAKMIGRTTGTTYDDTQVESGVVYYYWVQSRNATATAGFSKSDRGYAASGSVDLAVWNLVLLPDTVGTGSAPSVVSFRMGNSGSRSMVSPDTAVGIEFYASSRPKFGRDAILIGQMTQDITLPTGDDTVVIAESSMITMPDEEGDYYIFVKVDPVYPSSLVDVNQGNNITMRESPIHVSASDVPPYRAINDFDGDGISDLVVVSDGLWSIRTVDGRVIASDLLFGGPDFDPVSGDFSGNGVSDLTVYGGGMWFAVQMSGQIVMWGDSWGESGYMPVRGVYSGPDALASDLVVYDELSGAWYIRTSSGSIVSYFGGMGYLPVSGDYNGNGLSDIAVYHEMTGYWYIRTMDGDLILWAEDWGGPGFTPVSGDFNGDGSSDMALYYEPEGLWFIRSVSGDVILWSQIFGGPGFTPVAGDYTGDGRSDLALYHEESGGWYIITPDGHTVLWGVIWGGPGYKPIGR